MSIQPKPSFTFDDWLATERKAIETRSEYVAGEVLSNSTIRLESVDATLALAEIYDRVEL
jgi:hypothetical protein